MNSALREHVTRVGFDLTLAKTQIAALVYIDLAIRNKRTLARQGDIRELSPVAQLTNRHFVGGVRGCIERGLVTHRYIEPRRGRNGVIDPRDRDRPAKTFYQVTRAGRLVIDLLHECALYEDYAGPIGEQLLGLSA